MPTWSLHIRVWRKHDGQQVAASLRLKPPPIGHADGVYLDHPLMATARGLPSKHLRWEVGELVM